MSIDPNLLIAAKIVHDECDKNICCNKCQLCDICYDTCPDDWKIPEPLFGQRRGKTFWVVFMKGGVVDE